MKRRKITTFIGTGTLGPDHVVRVDDGTELVGTHVILASGSVPRSIPGFVVDGDLVMTSDEVLDLESLAGVGRGDRRRGDRLRVRVNAVRPGHAGHRP